MNKEVYYDISKEELIDRINALIDGNIKTSDIHLSGFEKYRGTINDDKFVLCASQSDIVTIRGVFIEDEKKIELDIRCNGLKYIWFILLNEILVLVIICGVIWHVYLAIIIGLLVMLIGNLFLIMIFRLTEYAHYDAISTLIMKK